MHKKHPVTLIAKTRGVPCSFWIRKFATYIKLISQVSIDDLLVHICTRHSSLASAEIWRMHHSEGWWSQVQNLAIRRTMNLVPDECFKINLHQDCQTFPGQCRPSELSSDFPQAEHEILVRKFQKKADVLPTPTAKLTKKFDREIKTISPNQMVDCYSNLSLP